MIQDIMRKVNQREEIEALKDAPDEAVLSASRTNPDVFELLVDRYEDAFTRKARHILRTREDAEEVVQDAFTRIYLYADRYKPQEGASFSSWGYAILIRLAFTRYQKMKKSRERTTDLDPEAYERLPDEAAFIEDLTFRDEVLMAFAKMPESAARVLRLQFIEGKSQEEIARLESSTVSAVKTRVHRAKKQFKEAFAINNAYDD
jgi:RNA polymerase sigma-70 factor, ECF subfamily